MKDLTENNKLIEPSLDHIKFNPGDELGDYLKKNFCPELYPELFKDEYERFNNKYPKIFKDLDAHLTPKSDEDSKFEAKLKNTLVEKLQLEYYGVTNVEAVTKTLIEYRQRMNGFWNELLEPEYHKRYPPGKSSPLPDADSAIDASPRIAYHYCDRLMGLGVNQERAEHLISITTGFVGRSLLETRNEIFHFKEFKVLPTSAFTEKDKFQAINNKLTAELDAEFKR